MGNALVLCNDDVARAKEAEAFAKGKMHVERNGAALLVGGDESFFVFLRAEGVSPDRCRRVTCITRARAIIAIDEIFAHRELFAHLPQVRIHECHGAYLRRAQGRACTAGCTSWSGAC